MNSKNEKSVRPRKLPFAIFGCCVMISLFTGCSQGFIVTNQGDPLSGENISYDQFNRLREGKYFEMILNDSSVVPITLIRASIDSIIFETGEESVRLAVPMGSVSQLKYHQNDNGFNAMIGGFGGLLLGGIAANVLFNLNDNDSSVKGFGTVITASVIGSLIGYNNETTLTYAFPTQKKKKF